MPVYICTIHAYRSWSEGNAKGYVQRDEGLKPTSSALQSWREDHSSHEPARFDSEQQRLLHEIAVEITRERGVRLHAAATVTTHIHQLISFRSPACTCGASAEFCGPRCPARLVTEQLLTRAKRKMGQQLAKHANTCGRPWLSRGWDITPVKDRSHFDYHRDKYLPDHERVQGGICRQYP